MDINTNLDYTTAEDGEIDSDITETDLDTERASANSGAGPASDDLSDKSNAPSVRPSGSHTPRAPTRGGGGRGGRGAARTSRANRVNSSRSKSPRTSNLKRHYTSPLESANKTVKTESKSVIKEPTFKHDSNGS